MAYWLLKTEPETWSWAMQLKRGSRGEIWSGVRNHTAKHHLMRMQRGDLAFFYHSGRDKAIVGIVEVTGVAFPDPTDPTGRFMAVTVTARGALKHPVSLTAAKAEPRLADMVLVNNTRLSVQPVTASEWKLICAMGAG